MRTAALALVRGYAKSFEDQVASHDHHNLFVRFSKQLLFMWVYNSAARVFLFGAEFTWARSVFSYGVSKHTITARKKKSWQALRFVLMQVTPSPHAQRMLNYVQKERSCVKSVRAARTRFGKLLRIGKTLLI
jgi:hypothetical protein